MDFGRRGHRGVALFCKNRRKLEKEVVIPHCLVDKIRAWATRLNFSMIQHAMSASYLFPSLPIKYEDGVFCFYAFILIVILIRSIRILSKYLKPDTTVSST